MQPDSSTLDHISGTLSKSKTIHIIGDEILMQKNTIIRDVMNIMVLNNLHGFIFFTALSALHSKTVFPMKLKKRKNLQSAKSRSALNQLTLWSSHLALDCCQPNSEVLFFTVSFCFFSVALLY